MRTFRVYYELNGHYWFRDVEAELPGDATMFVQDALGAGDYYFWRRPRELTKGAP